MVGISSGVAVSITYNGITLSKSDRESNSCWIWISPLYQAPIAIHWASLFWSLLSATSSVNPDKVLLSRALESINTLPWWFVTKRLNFVNGIGNITQPCIFIPHCSKANSYVFQRWTIQMRQAKSYLAFRCKIPKYIIHVILFAKGCISSTHYSCSYRSIISCCKWYRKYAYCYISRQTCRTSPL